MKRRTIGLIMTLALGLLWAPFTAAVQPSAKVWRIGLFPVGLDHEPPSLDPLREGLKALGYEEGHNLRLDWRNLPDEAAARETAQAFIRERVDLIVAFENQTVRAAKAATSEIPVLFLHAMDPVAAGFVNSLAYPGGNLTGFVTFPHSFPKQLELFKELVPSLRRVLVLLDPNDPMTPPLLAEVRRAGATLQLQFVERVVTESADAERVFGSVTQGDVDGVFIVSPDLLVKFPALILRLALERRLPLPSQRREWVEQGALFSYGPNYAAVGLDAAQYVDKLLKGTKPQDLPVQQMSRFELIINLKAAQALRLTIPHCSCSRRTR